VKFPTTILFQFYAMELFWKAEDMNIAVNDFLESRRKCLLGRVIVEGNMTKLKVGKSVLPAGEEKDMEARIVEACSLTGSRLHETVL
jgi:hypothetical protein